MVTMGADGKARASFMRDYDEKHTAMVEGDPGVIETIAGDHTGSEGDDSYRNDGHALTLATNTWRVDQDFNAPGLKPPRPDTGGIGRDPTTGDILWVPGLLMGNESPTPANPSGAWWRSKKTGLWRMDPGLVYNTGMMRGGVPDWTTRKWLSVYESASLGPMVSMWDVDNFDKSRRVDVGWGEPGVNDKFSYYASDSLPCIVGRVMYFIARTVIKAGGSEARFFGFNIDTRKTTRLASPPVSTWTVPESTLLAGAGTKVVFPHILGPDGVILGLYIYETLTNVWTQELTRPFGLPSNKFLMNAMCPVPSRGSVLFAGSAFGSTRQTTMIEFSP